MTKKQILLIALIISVFLPQCEDASVRTLPASAGSPGYILVVGEKHRWEQEPGKSIRKAFDEQYGILPQPEPKFEYSFIPEAKFGKLLRRSRNILFVKISQNIKKPQVVVKYDASASPQTVITVRAKDNEEFVKIFNKKSEAIVSLFEKKERERLIKAYSGGFLNPLIKKKLKEEHAYTLNVPKGYHLDVDKENFVCISRETPYSSQGILIWDYPYTDKSQLSPDSIAAKRNEFTSRYVEGPTDGTYMVIEDLIDPETRKFKLNGKYAVEMKGLWKLAGDSARFMSGPFMSFTTVNSKNNRIITVDGYVYGGRKKKINLIKQVEAVMYTLQTD